MNESPNYTKMIRSPGKDKIVVENVDGSKPSEKTPRKLSDKQLQLKNMILDCKINYTSRCSHILNRG